MDMSILFMMYQTRSLLIRLTGFTLIALALALTGLDWFAKIPTTEPWLEEFGWPSRLFAAVFGSYLWHVGRHYADNVFSEI